MTSLGYQQVATRKSTKHLHCHLVSHRCRTTVVSEVLRGRCVEKIAPSMFALPQNALHVESKLYWNSCPPCMSHHSPFSMSLRSVNNERRCNCQKSYCLQIPAVAENYDLQVVGRKCLKDFRGSALKMRLPWVRHASRDHLCPTRHDGARKCDGKFKPSGCELSLIFW